MNNANDIPQSERTRIMIEERRLRTYHGHAQHTDEDIYGGRFAKVNTTSVVGAGPISYPTQPANSPWASEPIGPEPLIDGRSEGNTFGLRDGQTQRGCE
jgi:hypothetical protein